MKDLRVCEHCGEWREKWHSCEKCGSCDIGELAPEAPPQPEGNSRSLRRMLKNKRRK